MPRSNVVAPPVLNIPVQPASLPRPSFSLCRNSRSARSLYPQKRTCAIQFGMSALCQKRTLGSFDHLVGALLNLQGYLEAHALAVLRLITNWNLVVCSTGRSAGFSPFRIRPV